MPYEDRDENPNPTPEPAPVNHYLGNLTEKTRKSGDKFLVGSICLEDVAAIPEEHITHGKNNGKRYVKIIVNPYRDGKNQYGNTHSVKVDTYRPQERAPEGTAE